MTTTTTGQQINFSTFQFWEENAIQATTEETFQNAISKTADPMAQGAYRLTWYCEMQVVASAELNSRSNLRFQVDGTSKGNTTVDSDEWVACSGWDRYWATEGEQPVLTIDWRRDPGVGGDDTVQIRRLKLGLEQMDEAG
jgi:hypothetical protein